MPRVGLEPTFPCGSTAWTVCVCQFRHRGVFLLFASPPATLRVAMRAGANSATRAYAFNLIGKDFPNLIRCFVPFVDGGKSFRRNCHAFHLVRPFQIFRNHINEFRRKQEYCRSVFGNFFLEFFVFLRSLGFILDASGIFQKFVRFDISVKSDIKTGSFLWEECQKAEGVRVSADYFAKQQSVVFSRGG